jgi:predicted Rossmann-fold nucleotide-binding protein
VAFYNVNGYFGKFIQMIEWGVAEGFIRAEHLTNLVIEDDQELLLQKLRVHEPVNTSKWIDLSRI